MRKFVILTSLLECFFFFFNYYYFFFQEFSFHLFCFVMLPLVLAYFRGSNEMTNIAWWLTGSCDLFPALRRELFPLMVARGQAVSYTKWRLFDEMTDPGDFCLET